MHSFVRQRQFVGHNSIKNSIDVSNGLPASGADDSTAKTWDGRQRFATANYELGSSVTAVALNDKYLFCATIDS